MKKILFTFITLLCLPLASARAADSPSVIVSIKPIHSLVCGVMEGVGTPQLLVKKGSPHGYSLRPSEAKALAKAELVIWVGHELESFLAKPLRTLAKNSHQLELAEELKADLLTKRQGGHWEASDHHHDGDHDHHDGDHDHHDHEEGLANADLHLWLSPKMAVKIVVATANTLIEIDPEHEQIYRDNAAQMQLKLTQLDQQLQQKLAPVHQYPYLVFHAAYQYFETAYNLNVVGSITIDPERTPGAKRIREIRHKLKQVNARCVFSEPQFESRLVATIIEGTGIKTAALDPLGTDIPAGTKAYFQLMQRLGDNLVKGLR